MDNVSSNDSLLYTHSGDGGAFRWNTNLYNEKHDFVAKYGEDVLEWLAPQKDEAVLDVGCGTGTLTNKIKESGAFVTGIDASAEMIETAKAFFPSIDFLVKDATDFLFNEHFDAAFSNATLHWINEQEKALQCVYNNLRSGGRFVFEMGGKHNVESIHNAVKKAMQNAGFQDKIYTTFNYFPSVAAQCVLLQKVGFTITDVAYFKRPTKLQGEDGMKNWIVQFCSYFFAYISSSETEKIIDNAVEILQPTNYKKETWYADYVRLRIKAIKED